jgi:hypothetical protein
MVLGSNTLGIKAPEVASLDIDSGDDTNGIELALGGPKVAPATRPVDWRPVFT